MLIIVTLDENVTRKLTHVKSHVWYRKDRHCYSTSFEYHSSNWIQFSQYNDYYKNIILRKAKMHGKTLQVSKLLAGLILIYIAGFCRAKHNFVGRDNGITNMKVTVGKGILCIFRTSGGFQYFKWN